MSVGFASVAVGPAQPCAIAIRLRLKILLIVEYCPEEILQVHSNQDGTSGDITIR
jgi:hypothetical protein